MNRTTPWLSACVLSLLGLASAPAPAETARGVVYLDQDGDGVRGESEPGLTGVRVSNGQDVTRTDNRGRYQLPLPDDGIVFVVKPRGYMTRRDELNLPRFYYLHKPEGSPDADFVFKGVAPTGPAPDSIDFPLTRSEEPDEFKVIIMGDPQPSTRAEVGYYANDVLAGLADTDAVFGVAMGDLVGDDLALFEPLNRAHAKLGITWYNVHGNHDMNFMAKDDRYADETFERVYGPADYAFQYASVHFIILDNVFWKGRQLNDAGRPTNGNYEGRLTDAQLRFVENYVRTVPRDEPIVVCTHIPLFNPVAVQHSTPQAPRLMEILSGHEHSASFSGHTHIQRNFYVGSDQGYAHPSGRRHPHHNVATASGSWYRGPKDERGLPIATMRDGGPNGHVIATFSQGDYSVRYKAAGLPDDYQLAVHVGESTDGGAREVLANVFNGSERSEVRMRVDGGPWREMEQTITTWPPYADLVEAEKRRVAGTDRVPLPGAEATPHIWRAELPGDLAPGWRAIEVETTDAFGQTDRAWAMFEAQ